LVGGWRGTFTAPGPSLYERDTTAMDDQGVVEILAVPPRERSGWFWSLAFIAWLLDALSGGGQWSGGGTKSTRVLVRYRGRQKLLFKEASLEVAEEKVERVAAEYEDMDTEEWCKRYRVPKEFFSD
jgi:hypothetical protein